MSETTEQYLARVAADIRAHREEEDRLTAEARADIERQRK